MLSYIPAHDFLQQCRRMRRRRIPHLSSARLVRRSLTRSMFLHLQLFKPITSRSLAAYYARCRSSCRSGGWKRTGRFGLQRSAGSLAINMFTECMHAGQHYPDPSGRSNRHADLPDVLRLVFSEYEWFDVRWVLQSYIFAEHCLYAGWPLGLQVPRSSVWV